MSVRFPDGGSIEPLGDIDGPLREALLTVDSMLIAGASPGTVRTIIQEALVEHSCEWCPLHARDLFALAANAVNSYGTEREAKKMAALKHAVEHYQAGINAHFEAIKRA